MMRVRYASLGFAPSYEVETDPEFPAAGEWRVPVFRIDGHGVFLTADTLTIRVRPAGSETWVSWFAVEPRAGSVGLYGCPSPNDLLVATGTDAFLIDVRDPGHARKVPIEPVRIVHHHPATGLLLIGSYTNLAAVDGGGLRWVTGRLCIDDLELVEGAPDKICVRGSVKSVPGLELLVIEPSNGDLIAGSRYVDAAHPHGEPTWRRERHDR